MKAMELINAPDVWEDIVNYMEDEFRENVHYDLAPCTNREFLLEYCERDASFPTFLEQRYDIVMPYDLDFPYMSLDELESLDGLTFSFDELEQIEQLEKVSDVESCGTSGRYPEKTWWDVTLSSGKHIDVYTGRC